MASPDDPPKRRLSVPDYWQQYGVCILFFLLLPLLPIAIEYFTIGYFRASTLAISAVMYAMSIGTSSTSILEFGLCLAGSLIFAVMFGIQSAAELGKDATALASWNSAKTSSFIFIGFIFVLHAITRYNRHVSLKQPFWEFTK